MAMCIVFKFILGKHGGTRLTWDCILNLFLISWLDWKMMVTNYVYTDNYYTSPQLYLTLYKKGIDCATVWMNWNKFSPELVHHKGEHLERGFYDYRSNGPLLAAFWVDRQFIHFVITLHYALPSSGAVTTITMWSRWVSVWSSMSASTSRQSKHTWEKLIMEIKWLDFITLVAVPKVVKSVHILESAYSMHTFLIDVVNSAYSLGTHQWTS